MGVGKNFRDRREGRFICLALFETDEPSLSSYPLISLSSYLPLVLSINIPLSYPHATHILSHFLVNQCVNMNNSTKYFYIEYLSLIAKMEKIWYNSISKSVFHIGITIITKILVMFSNKPIMVNPAWLVLWLSPSWKSVMFPH